MEELFPNVFRIIEPKYSNCIYYIDDKKKVQIDAGVVLDDPIDFLILTHCHFDHIRCAAEIKKKNPNCQIAASEEATVHIKNMDEATRAQAAGEKVENDVTLLRSISVSLYINSALCIPQLDTPTFGE